MYSHNSLIRASLIRLTIRTGYNPPHNPNRLQSASQSEQATIRLTIRTGYNPPHNPNRLQSASQSEQATDNDSVIHLFHNPILMGTNLSE